jgi:hypothetical protein
MTARRRAWASESERRTAVLLAISKYRRISFACEETRVYQEAVPSQWSSQSKEKNRK